MFYSLGDNSIFSRKWVWAWSVKPMPDEIGVLCDVCQRGRLYPGRYPQRPLEAYVGPLDGQPESDFKYPDILGCAAPYLIVSDTVISDWETHNITGYRKFLIEITQATDAQIKRAVPPKYYHIEVTGRCQLDLDASGIRIVYLCPKCGYREEELLEDNPVENPFGSFPFAFHKETWDGSDLFVSDLFDRTYFCSQKIFDLASQNKHTNFRFVLPEDSGKDGNWAIDYMTET
jgi:hypothetical protein